MMQSVTKEVGAVYRGILAEIMPAPVNGRTKRARSRALREAGYGNVNFAKFFAINVIRAGCSAPGPVLAQLEAAEMMLLSDILVPISPAQVYKFHDRPAIILPRL